jgi:hypothetical protein
MADSTWQTLTQPFRTAAASLLGTTVELRELGEDKAFWRLLSPLDSLPEAARFQPLVSTREWQIELTQQSPQAHPQEAGDEAFSQRMQRRATQRGKLALLKQTQAEEPSADQGQRAAPGSEPSATHRAEQAPDAPQSAGKRTVASPRGAGVWTVIEQIATLTRALEPSAGARADQAKAAHPTAGSTPGSSTQARTERPQRATTSARAAAATTTGVAHRFAPSVGHRPDSASPQQPPTEAGLELLADYVNQLWPTREPAEPGASQAQSDQPAPTETDAQPAPRAPSLLQAGDNLLAREITGVGLRTNDKQAPDRARDAPIHTADEQSRAGSQRAVERQADEELEASINRALIEQAWLRGVDLT